MPVRRKYEVFGPFEIRRTASLRKTRHKGIERVGWMFELTVAYNLVKLPKLRAACRLIGRSPV